MPINLYFNKNRFDTFEVGHRFTCFFIVNERINKSTVKEGQIVNLTLVNRASNRYIGQVLEVRQCSPTESRFQGEIKQAYTDDVIQHSKILELWVKVVSNG